MLEPKFSLSWYKRHPLLVCNPIQCATPTVATAIKWHMTNAKTVSPDEEALAFYAMNHVFGIIQQKYDKDTPLPQAVMELVGDYIAMVCNQAERMMYYTVLITTREARHCYQKKDLHHSLEKLTTYPFWSEYLDSITDSSSTIFDKFHKSAPPIPFDKYMEGLTYTFMTGKFGGGYGGKPWGEIAKNLHRAVSGEVSMEMFVDTAYTLAHNNGPAFNKGMLYDMYSGEFIKILDVQRSGQIPQYIMSANKESHKKMATWLTHAAKIIGLDLLCEPTTYVDWYKVEALGSAKKYPNEKNSQVAMFGSSSPYINVKPKDHVKPTASMESKAAITDPTPTTASPVPKKKSPPWGDSAPEGFTFIKDVKYGVAQSHVYKAYARKPKESA